MDKFDQWCVVEVMGHKKFAGRVTEGPFGLVQIDVPEVTLSSGQIVPPFSKMLGAHAIYAMTPCTEETARAFAKEFRSQAFQTYELPALTAPKSPYAPERDPEWDADNDDLEADEEAIRRATIVVEGPPFRTCNCGDREVCDVCQNITIDPPVDAVPEEVDKRFLDPLDGEPF